MKGISGKLRREVRVNQNWGPDREGGFIWGNETFGGFIMMHLYHMQAQDDNCAAELALLIPRSFRQRLASNWGPKKHIRTTCTTP